MKDKNKQWVIKLVLLTELAVFCGVYFFGQEGLPQVNRLKQEGNEVAQEVIQLTQEVEALESKIIAFEEHPIHKEKIAREDLQLAYESEEVYYIS